MFDLVTISKYAGVAATLILAGFGVPIPEEIPIVTAGAMVVATQDWHPESTPHFAWCASYTRAPENQSCGGLSRSLIFILLDHPRLVLSEFDPFDHIGAVEHGFHIRRGERRDLDPIGNEAGDHRGEHDVGRAPAAEQEFAAGGKARAGLRPQVEDSDALGLDSHLQRGAWAGIAEVTDVADIE